jgi:hypothetical protein
MFKRFIIKLPILPKHESTQFQFKNSTIFFIVTDKLIRISHRTMKNSAHQNNSEKGKPKLKD